MQTRYISASPAYGRDYPPGEQGEEQVRADWERGKDFRIRGLNSGYVNKDDKPAEVQLNIRYNKLQDICVIAATDVQHEEAKAQFDERDYLDRVVEQDAAGVPHFVDDDEHTIVDDYMPGYHGEGELADFDPNTGRSSMDDWLK